MKLEKRVPSRKLAKQLKEAGYKQKGIWWHNNQGLGHWHIGHFRNDMSEFVAPTIKELGERLFENLVEFIHENLDDLSIELFFEYCNLKRPLFNPNFLAKIWLLSKKKDLL